jgi:hypothetical protein
VLHGHHPSPNELVSGDARQLVAVQRFVELMILDRALPRAHVSYFREAWISPHDNSVRVTMDRRVLISPEFVTRFTEKHDDPTCVFGDMVILELKFTGRFPDWFKQLVRVFGLRQCSASKYADGIAIKGEHHFNVPGAVPMLPHDAVASDDRKRARLARINGLLAVPAHA